MKMPRNKTEARRHGDLGEWAAARYLRRRFYRILERNWFFYRKEIDIIAKRGKTLVFCEVKTRTREDAPSPYGTPGGAVTAEKQRNLLAAAEGYLRMIGKHPRVRMDVIEVYLKRSSNGNTVKIERIVHIQNAFTA